MKKITLPLIICIVLMLTACPRNAPDRRVIDAIIASYTSEFRSDQLRYDCYVRGYDFSGSGDSITCVTGVAPDKPKFADDARRVRDAVTSRFLRVIDSNFEQFANDLQNRRATSNFLGDITELGLGAATGISNGERVLQILGVAMTAFRGGRKSIDQSFYERQSTPILITKMDTSRDRVMSAILQKREKFGADKYSLEDSLGDVIKYFWAGTLTRAFVELAKDSSLQAKTAEDQLLIVQGVEINPIPSLVKQRASANLFDQRVILAKQFRDAESLLVAADKAAAIAKIVAKYEMIWRELEAKDEFKSIVAEIKTNAAFTATVTKFGTQANPPTRTEVDQLFAKIVSRISEEDDKAGNTKLAELLTSILTKTNK